METLLTTRELSKKIRVAIQTITGWRCDRPPKGPPYIKLGGKVLYPVDAVDKWIASRTVDPAAQQNPKRTRRRRALVPA